VKHVHLEFSLAKRNFLLHDGPLGEGSKTGKKKFVLFANYRTGSHLLKGLLNCHPDIHCDDEIFKKSFLKTPPQKILFPTLFLEERFREAKSMVYGVDLKLDHICTVFLRRLYDPQRFMKRLNRKGWKIIFIRRTNVLRQALSNLLALKRQTYQVRSESERLQYQDKLSIGYAPLINEMKKMEKISLLEDRVLQQLPHIRIQYEEDLLNEDNHQQTVDRICDFLEIPKAPVQAQHVRLSSDNIQDFIGNYPEIVKAVRNTKYSKYLVN